MVPLRKIKVVAIHHVKVKSKKNNSTAIIAADPESNRFERGATKMIAKIIKRIEDIGKKRILKALLLCFEEINLWSK